MSAPLPAQRRRLGSWRARVALAFLALIVPVTLWEASNLAERYRSRTDEVLREQVLLAEGYARTVEAFLDGVVNSLAIVAGSITHAGPMSSAEASRYLEAVRPSMQATDYLVLTDADGVVVAAAPGGRLGVSLLDREAARAVLREGRTSAVNPLVQGRVMNEMVIGAAHVIRDRRGRTRGAVLAAFRHATLGRVLAGHGLPPDAAVVIIDSNARMAYNTRYPDLPWNRRDLSDSPRVAAALAGQSRAYDRYTSRQRGTERAGAIAPVRKIGWAVAATRDRATILAPVRRDIATGAARAALLPLLLVALATAVGRRLLRPVHDLAAAAQALGDGRFATRVRVDDTHELGAVGRAFNAMAERLESQMAEEEAARQRADWLAAVSAELAASLDVEATLAAVARLARGRLGECAVVEVVDESGAAGRLTSSRSGALCEAGHGADCPIGAESGPEALVADRTHLALDAAAAVLRVPLRSRGRVVGRLSLARTGDARRFTQADVALAEGLARRAGLAADNARLYRDARLAEARLGRQLAYTEALTRSLGEGVVALDPAGRVTFVNPVAESILGGRERDLVGRPFHDLAHPEPETAPCALAAAIRGGGASAWADDRFAGRPGEPAPVDVAASPILADGERVGTVLTFRDTTRRKRLEAELRHAQKMEAIGRLAGGVAHDFNNILTAIIGYTDLILQAGNDRAAIDRETTEVRRAADRASDLTRQLLAFSRKQTLNPSVLDLNAVVANVEGMLRRVIGEDVVLVTRLDPATGCIKADRSQVEQVLLNLAVNARDAMPGGGRLEISTRSVRLDDPAFLRRAELAPGRYAVLVVRDSGVGMDRDTMVRLFEPFFTTKERGKGTGLGLSTVYGIVKQSRGHVAVESAPGEGSSFAIYLPSVDEAAPPDPRPAPAERVRQGGQKTVLLVEDDDMVRRFARQVLESNGYSVLEAAGGEEALALAERAAGLALLLTDVVMPGLNGRQVAERVSALKPGLRVLYMSGYTENIIGQGGLLGPDTVLLSKPFTAALLLDRVRKVIEGR